MFLGAVMEQIITLLGIAIIAFISTNIDDFFVLAAFFSDNSYSKKTVIIGQYIGMLIIIAVSCIGYIFKMLLPMQWVGILGVLPIMIGSKHIVRYVKNRKRYIDDNIISINTSNAITIENIDEQKNSTTNIIKKIVNSKISFVAMVTFSNGGDNLGIYVPLFASLNLSELIFTIVMFLIMVAVWCEIVIFFANNKLTGIIFKKYGKSCFPFVLILLGVYIIIKCNTLSLLK